MRIAALLVMLCATALLACDFGDLDPESATAVYLRTIRHLAFDRHAIDPAALQDIAEGSAPVNPIVTGDIKLAEASAHAFDIVIRDRLAGVDWKIARVKLAEMARELAHIDARDEVSRGQTASIIAPRVLVADLANQTGQRPSEVGTYPDAVVGGDGLLYVLQGAALPNESEKAPLYVIRTDGVTSVAVPLPAGTIKRTLVTSAKGEVFAACLTGHELHMVDLRDGSEKRFPISRTLAAHLEANRQTLKSWLSAPEFFIVDNSIVLTWREDQKRTTEVIALDGKKPLTVENPSHEIFFYSPPDRKSLLAYSLEFPSNFLQVRDIASGKTLFREPMKRSRRLDPPDVWLRGTQVAAVDGDGLLKVRDFATGEKRDVPFTLTQFHQYGFVPEADGRLGFLVQDYHNGYMYLAPGAHAFRTSADVPFINELPKFFLTHDGKRFAVGQPLVANVMGRLPKLEFVDMESGAKDEQPLAPNLELRSVHQMPDGRVLGVMTVRSNGKGVSSSIVQLYGPTVSLR